MKEDLLSCEGLFGLHVSKKVLIITLSNSNILYKKTLAEKKK